MGKTALLYGFLGSNVGDVAVTRGAIELIRNLGVWGPLAIVTPKLNIRARETWRSDIIPHFPYPELIEWDFKALPVQEPVNQAVIEAIASDELLKQLNIDDAHTLIYAGGEHLFSYGRPGDDWQLLLRLAPFFAAAKSGKKIVLSPSTFGPFLSPISESLIRRFLSLLPDIPVRDTVSKDLLASLGFEGRYCLDPAFFISHTISEPMPAKPAVNVIMRLDRYGLRIGNEKSLEYAAELEEHGYDRSLSYCLHRDVARELLKAGLDARLFIQTLADDKPTRAMHEELASEFGERVTLLKPLTIASFISELEKGSATVTSRFHGAIFSMLAARPAISIHFDEHGHKIPGLFDGLGIGDLCFNGASSTAAAVAAVAAAATKSSLSSSLPVEIGYRREESLRTMSPHFPRTSVVDPTEGMCRSCGVAITDEETTDFGPFCVEHGLEREAFFRGAIAS